MHIYIHIYKCILLYPRCTILSIIYATTLPDEAGGKLSGTKVQFKISKSDPLAARRRRRARRYRILKKKYYLSIFEFDFYVVQFQAQIYVYVLNVTKFWFLL